MKVVDRFNVSKSPEGPRKFTFEFTGPGLISIVVVTVLGIVWVFILGVLMGRGYKPEIAVPQLGQIMPSTAAPAQPEQKEPPLALKAEELHFMDNLQGKKGSDTVTVDSTAKSGDKTHAKPAATEPNPPPAVISTSVLEKSPAPLPKGKVATAPALPDKKTAALDHQREVASAKEAVAREKAQETASRDSAAREKAAKEKAAREAKDAKEAKDARDAKELVARDTAAAKEKAARDAAAAKALAGKGEPRMRVTYQVAAYDDKKQAQAEADHLAKKGLNASPTETKADGKTVFRILVRVVGTEAEIKAALEKTGSKTPVLRYQKPL